MGFWATILGRNHDDNQQSFHCPQLLFIYLWAKLLNAFVCLHSVTKARTLSHLLSHSLAPLVSHKCNFFSIWPKTKWFYAENKIKYPYSLWYIQFLPYMSSSYTNCRCVLLQTLLIFLSVRLSVFLFVCLIVIIFDCPSFCLIFFVSLFSYLWNCIVYGWTRKKRTFIREEEGFFCEKRVRFRLPPLPIIIMWDTLWGRVN